MGRDDKTWRDSPVVKGLKIFFCPLVMLWVEIYLYVVPCCTAYCIRAYLRLFNKCCGCACCKFRDKAFPAEPASIGTVEALMKMSVGGAGKAGDVSVVNKLADAMKGGGGHAVGGRRGRFRWLRARKCHDAGDGVGARRRRPRAAR